MRVWVTRPEPDAAEQAEALALLGYDTHVAPLLGIELLADASLVVDGMAGIVATSRNGLRAIAGRRELPALARLPLFAVGAATSALARELGWRTVVEGGGRAEGLAKAIEARLAPGAGAILHLAGETLAHDLAGDLRALGFRLDQPVLYRSKPVAALAAATLAAIEAGTIDAVILMSPRTAATYVALIEAAGLEARARRLIHACLSDAVAARLARLSPCVLLVARKPTSEELLALLLRHAAQSTDERTPDTRIQ